MNSFEINKVINELGGYIELMAVMLSIIFLIFLVKIIRIKSPKLVVPFKDSTDKTINRQSDPASATVSGKTKPIWKMKSPAHRSRNPTIYKPKRTIRTQKTFSK